MRLKQIVGGERLVVEWIGKLPNIFFVLPNFTTNPTLLPTQKTQSSYLSNLNKIYGKILPSFAL